MTVSKPLIKTKVVGSMIIAGLILGFLIPLAAVDVPSLGDGAEMVMAASIGSLVHPPGFPILSAINEGVLGLFRGHAYQTLSRASVIEHALASLLLFWVLSFWLKRVMFAGAMTLAVMLSPAAIMVATDAEVFALHHLFVALILWTALSAYRKPSLFGVLVLGFVFGLAGAHHPISIFWLPLALLPFVKGVTEKFKHLFAMLLAALIGLSPYFTLFERFEARPQWAFGHVTTFTELYHHIMRTTYGTLKLSGDFDGATTRLLQPFLSEALWCVPALLLLWLYGLYRSYQEKNMSRLILGFVFITHLIFLLLAHMPNHPAALELGSRFYSSVMLALLVGALPGCFYILDERHGLWSWLCVGALITPVLLSIPNMYARAHESPDRVARDFINATFESLPQNAIFIAQHDAEAFGMLHDQAVIGTRKDVRVVVQGRLSTPWYRQQLMKQLPFLQDIKLNKSEPFLQIIQAAQLNAIRIFASFPFKLPAGYRMRPLGVGWEIYPRADVPHNKEIIDAVLENCMNVTTPLKAPLQPSAASLSILENLAGGYVALVQTLKADGQDTLALEQGIAALRKGEGFTALKNACRQSHVNLSKRSDQEALVPKP